MENIFKVDVLMRNKIFQVTHAYSNLNNIKKMEIYSKKRSTNIGHVGYLVYFGVKMYDFC